MRIRMTGLVACWWVIWTVRNEAIFRKVQPDPPRAVYKIKQLVNLWEQHTYHISEAVASFFFKNFKSNLFEA